MFPVLTLRESLFCNKKYNVSLLEVSSIQSPRKYDSLKFLTSFYYLVEQYTWETTYVRENSRVFVSQITLVGIRTASQSKPRAN